MKRGVTKADLSHDLGVHYALGQFTLSGKFAAPMPPALSSYHLAVETGRGLARVYVSAQHNSSESTYFPFFTDYEFDWIVFVLKSNEHIRAWIMPDKVALNRARGSERSCAREMSLRSLESHPLGSYEDNWQMKSFQSATDDILDSLGEW